MERKVFGGMIWIIQMMKKEAFISGGNESYNKIKNNSFMKNLLGRKKSS